MFAFPLCSPQEASAHFLRADVLSFAMRYYSDGRSMTSRVSKAKERAKAPHARRRVSSNVPVAHIDPQNERMTMGAPTLSAASMHPHHQHGHPHHHQGGSMVILPQHPQHTQQHSYMPPSYTISGMQYQQQPTYSMTLADPGAAAAVAAAAPGASGESMEKRAKRA